MGNAAQSSQLPVPIYDEEEGELVLTCNTLKWVQAAEVLVEALKGHYPYTAHRRIDWRVVLDRFRPQIARAQEQNDKVAYYVALRDLATALQDGHVGVEWTGKLKMLPFEAARRDVGGGFGACFARLDSGRVAVVYVAPPPKGKSPCPLQQGDVITHVDGITVDDFLSKVSLRWCALVPATRRAVDDERCRFLSRAPAGTRRTFTTQERGDVLVKATEQDGDTAAMQRLSWLPEDSADRAEAGRLVTFRVVTAGGRAPGMAVMATMPGTTAGAATGAGDGAGDGAGAEVPAPAATEDVDAEGGSFKVGLITIPTFDNKGKLPQRIEEALGSFAEAGVQGVVIDLRGNDGGDDEEPPQLLSFFGAGTEEQHLEDVAVTAATARVMERVGHLPPPPPPLNNGGGGDGGGSSESGGAAAGAAPVAAPETAEKATEKASSSSTSSSSSSSSSSTSTAEQPAEPPFEIIQRTMIRPHPTARRWRGPLAVLVNRATVSNGDMAAMALKEHSGAAVVGFEGTSGSVSFSGATVRLPMCEFHFTLGQSWDKHGAVQLEANAAGVGGVLPTHPLPRTVDALESRMRWQLRRLEESRALEKGKQVAKGKDQVAGEGGADPPDIELAFAVKVLHDRVQRADAASPVKGPRSGRGGSNFWEDFMDGMLCCGGTSRGGSGSGGGGAPDKAATIRSLSAALCWADPPPPPPTASPPAPSSLSVDAATGAGAGAGEKQKD